MSFNQVHSDDGRPTWPLMRQQQGSQLLIPMCGSPLRNENAHRHCISDCRI